MSLSADFPTTRPSLLLDFVSTQTLDPRITFTRATTATYYDSNTVAKAEENLFLRSQEFDNAAWIKSRSSVTANNETAPDGTATADTLTADGTADFPNDTSFNTSSFSATGDKVISAFIKKGTNDFVQIYVGANVNVFANFDLDAGTVGTVGAQCTASIISVGSGWYRCVVITSQTNPTSVAFNIVTSDTAPRRQIGGTSNSIILWGAQLEQRDAVTDYTPTTTQPITNYVPVLLTAPAGQARFDFNPVTRIPNGLLIEEQRTNLLTYSEEFDNAAWTKIRASITANTIVAPDGTLTGDKLVENTDNNSHFCSQSTTLTANAVYTLSVYAKAGERPRIQVQTAFINNWSAQVATTFDLVTGTVANGTGIITPVGNGWYRCSITATFGTSNATGGLNIITIEDGSVNQIYTGDGYSGIYIWGAQLEQAAFSTSYIPTTSATVTRNADAATMTGTNFSSWYAGGAGTVYSESAVYASNIKTQCVWDLSGGTSSTSLRSPQTTVNRIRAQVGNTFSGLNAGATISNNTFIKATVAWQGLSGRLQSGAIGEDVTGAANLDATQFIVGGLGSAGSTSLNGHIRRIAYYPFRLTNAQLQALTS